MQIAQGLYQYLLKMKQVTQNKHWCASNLEITSRLAILNKAEFCRVSQVSTFTLLVMQSSRLVKLRSIDVQKQQDLLNFY